MKIVFYCTSLTRSAGGLFYAVAGLASALAAAGQDVTVVGGRDEHFDEDRHVWRDVKLITRPLKNTYGFDFRFLSDIHGARPDVLHLHGIWSAGAIYARAIAALGTPVVVSPHGMLDPWIMARRSRVKQVHAALFERPVLRRGHTHVLNVSEREAVAHYLPGLGERIFVEPNGISAPEVEIPDRGKSGFLYLGRLHPKKQLVEFLEHWRADGAHGEGLTVAGWGDAEYTDQVRALCEQIEGAEFVGPIYGQAKSCLLARARWLVLPSLSEGQPMAALEALQHGCVPILTRECNLEELFRHGAALEMKSDFSDFPDMVARTQQMDEADLDALSRRCMEKAADYSWERIAGHMIEHYTRIIGI